MVLLKEKYGDSARVVYTERPQARSKERWYEPSRCAFGLAFIHNERNENIAAPNETVATASCGDVKGPDVV